MGRFETRWLTLEKNLSALADLSGRWIDIVHGRRPPGGARRKPARDRRCQLGGISGQRYAATAAT